MSHFAHLHLHTDYSLLDGAITIERMIAFCKEQQMKAVGISDHGNIFGAVKFFQQAHKAGIKPVLGMEAYFTEDIKVKQAENKYYHLLLVVENEIGYKNLCLLNHYAYSEGFYFKPRIDYALLAAHAEGLSVTSACLGGHIPNLLMAERYAEADERIDWFLRVFGEKRFYLEVQPADQAEQQVLNERIFSVAQRRGLQTIATGDCHYVTPQDHEAHEVMLSIQTHHKLTDANRYTFGDCRVYMRTQQQMLDAFPGHPEAVWASGELADRVDFKFTTGKLFFPQFELPAGTGPEDYFRALCRQGLSDLFTAGRIDTSLREQYAARLHEEAELIITMGFVGYFLVVSDFISWAKKTGIPVGPGRGSAAGSLVAWALQITDIDPIKYNLLFERFLNPERITMPDIDIDFCIEGRERVINYVRDRYGHDKVCQIITFGTMMAKGVLKDVGRVLGLPFEDTNALTDLVPDQLKITLKEALETEPRLCELKEKNPRVAQLFDIAFRLEGVTRHASKHAAGIVISPEPIKEVLPVYVPPKSTDLVTQYGMSELEYLGFLKMDFLGLKNLTLIKQVVDAVREHRGITIDINYIPLDDAAAYALLSRGDTSGVFQLESDGIKDVLRRLHPKKFEDIIAVNALYRPGPLGSGMVDDFIERRHGRQQVTYLFPELESVLSETYGTIVYQEQVMKIASVIAGYSLGEADILRRAMGKKKADVMAEQRTLFVDRATQRNFNGTKAGELFDLIAYFAGYGFNKSHSAAYALIAYQTAYLKANYLPEFMAALITLEAQDPEKMAVYVVEAREHGISILPPDINASAVPFTVTSGAIRYGFEGIKHVGGVALDVIMAARAEKPFTDLLDFCMRVDARTVNKRVVESLICAGAFDGLPGSRAQKMAELARVMDIALERKKAAQTGQMGLFMQEVTLSSTVEPYHFGVTDEWSTADTLAKELEVLGLYVSAQPLDAYREHIYMVSARTVADIRHTFNTPGLGNTMTRTIMAGMVKVTKSIITKKGEPMAFAQLEDATGRIELILFPKTYGRVQPWLEKYTVFAVTGQLDADRGEPALKVQSCVPLDLLMQGVGVSRVTLELATLQADALTRLREKLVAGTLPLSIQFFESGKTMLLETKQKIVVDDALCAFAREAQVALRLELA